MQYGRFIVPPTKTVIQPNLSKTLRCGWHLPTAKQIPIQIQQPYQTSKRTLTALSFPMIVGLFAAPNKLETNLDGFTLKLYVDLYINRQLVLTQEVELVRFEFDDSAQAYIGVLSHDFQNPLPLPNPAELVIGYHGVVPAMQEGEFGSSVLTIFTNYEMINAGEQLQSQGSFSYTEEVISSSM